MAQLLPLDFYLMTKLKFPTKKITSIIFSSRDENLKLKT